MPEPGLPIGSLLRARSVAVVGASPTHPVRRQVVANFAALGSSARVAAVNPKHREVCGVPCYPRLASLPFVPDVVVAAVGRRSAPSVIENAAAIGAPAAVVFATGFAEIGPEGHALQERMRQAAANARMVLLGPNCQGVVNFWASLPLYMEVVDPYEPGPVALVSQSGSVTTALANSHAGVRWGCIVSSGNESIVGAADLLAYWIDDPDISVVCAYLEAIRDPRAFFAQCDRAADRGKPVIVLKSGRTEAARQAAVTHSGVLSPPDRLLDELFKRHGVIRADSMEELLGAALAVQVRRPRGTAIGATSASGGEIELALDCAGAEGLNFPAFTAATASRLAEILPEHLPVANPVDYWGVSEPQEAYKGLLNAVAEDPGVDIVMGLTSGFSDYPTKYPGADEEHYQLATAASVAATIPKTVVVIDPIHGGPPAALVEEMLRKNVLVLGGLPLGFKVLKMAATAARPPAQPTARRASRETLRGLVDPGQGHIIVGAPALRLLDAMGLAVPQSLVAATAAGATRAAAQVGYPVAMKLEDGQTVHKTDVEGVELRLEDDAAVRGAFERLNRGAGRSVLVQHYVHGGLELFIGLQTHAFLGTFIVVGFGGVWAEVLNDVSIRPVGLRANEAMEMLSELRGYPILAERGQKALLDLPAVLEAIHCVDNFGFEFGAAIDSIDVNPLIVVPAGAYAVDAAVVLANDG